MAVLGMFNIPDLVWYQKMKIFVFEKIVPKKFREFVVDIHIQKIVKLYGRSIQQLLYYKYI